MDERKEGKKEERESLWYFIADGEVGDARAPLSAGVMTFSGLLSGFMLCKTLREGAVRREAWVYMMLGGSRM